MNQISPWTLDAEGPASGFQFGNILVYDLGLCLMTFQASIFIFGKQR